MRKIIAINFPVLKGSPNIIAPERVGIIIWQVVTNIVMCIGPIARARNLKKPATVVRSPKTSPIKTVYREVGLPKEVNSSSISAAMYIKALKLKISP